MRLKLGIESRVKERSKPEDGGLKWIDGLTNKQKTHSGAGAQALRQSARRNTILLTAPTSSVDYSELISIEIPGKILRCPYLVFIHERVKLFGNDVKLFP